MRVSISTATIGLLSASLLISLPAGAQCNISNTLNGQTWAFQASDELDAAVGIFTAQVVPARGGGLTGQLNITESAFTLGYGPQQATQVTGTYTVDPDCSGGVLYFTAINNVFQYHFVLAAGGTRMFLVAENDNAFGQNGEPTGIGNHGSAVLLPGLPTCGGANPLSVFAGKWSFGVHDIISASDGIMTASVVGTTGLLTVIESTLGLLAHSPGIDLPSQGSYQVYPDCSGGTVSLNSGVNNSYAFVFAGPNQIYMVGLAPVPYLNVSPMTIASNGTAFRY